MDSLEILLRCPCCTDGIERGTTRGGLLYSTGLRDEDGGPDLEADDCHVCRRSAPGIRPDVETEGDYGDLDELVCAIEAGEAWWWEEHKQVRGAWLALQLFAWWLGDFDFRTGQWPHEKARAA